MIQAILFGALGIIFLAALLLWARPSEGRPRSVPAVEVPRIFTSFSIRLPSPQITRKIFSEEDLQYVREAGGPAAERKYLESRRNLSRLWLAEVRGAVKGLFRLYRTVVRHHLELAPTVELLVLYQYLRFLLFAGMFDFLLARLGPYRAVGLIRGAERRAERLIAALALPLGNCSPAILEQMESEWRQQQAPAR